MREIKPSNNNGAILIRFSVAGHRYHLSPIPGGRFDNKQDLKVAQAIATRISLDVLSGNFDGNLDRYHLTPKSEVLKAPEAKPKSLLDLWDSWVGTLSLSAATKGDHYKVIRSQISKADPKPLETHWFTEADLAASTFNTRLGFLRRLGKWALQERLMDLNPWELINSRKVSRQPIKPFDAREIKLILQGFKTMYPRWLSYTKFLLATGVRSGEAIGLQWKHINFERGELTIAESLSRDRTGNGYRKIRKGTKTGSIRVLPMSEPLRSLLLALRPEGAKPDALIFQNRKGGYLSESKYRETWIKVLAAQRVEYRCPYKTRHTCLSHAIEQGVPITGVAYLAGHSSTAMVIQHYGHMVNRPSLPKLDLD